MKIIDSQGKLFSKINIIDLAIVIAVIVLALSAFMKFDKAEKNMSADKIIEYTMEVTRVRKPTIDAINVNSKIEDDEKGKYLGEIIDMEVSKAVDNVELADGTYKKVQLQDKFDVLLTIRVEGTETADNFYTIEGQKLIVGNEIDINNGNVLCTGTVRSVHIVEEP